ncbi:hypothetical protein [Isoptericola sp. NPDC019482]|uniref:hypothetical protein n=1 Tax=Isoptericola sp. NPDC019482 TaxID=3154688 RepID=UPI003498C04F
MTAPDIFSVVSVDVVALAYDRSARRVLVAAPVRTRDPFRGETALPGVVVHSGERLVDAAHRALDKVGATSPPGAVGQLRTFDEPARDPRGPSLSVAMWAAYAPSDAPPPGGPWFPVDDAPHLAFDHDRILAASRAIVAGMLWRDLDLTRALTGPELTATDAVAITEQLTGQVHRGNLNRDLARLPGLVEAGLAHGGRGRPAKVWRWT